MKAIIIYYSVGGNTRKIAHAIHKGIGKITDQCDICGIKGAKGVPGLNMGHLLQYDLIGIGAPVWSSTTPPNVLNFINNIPSFRTTDLHKTGFRRDFTSKAFQSIRWKERHGLIFFTHASSVSQGVTNPPKMIWSALEKRDIRVIAWNHWFGEGREGWGIKPCAAHGHPDHIDLKDAEDWGKEVVERSRRIYMGATGLFPELPKGKEYRKIYGGETYKDHPKLLSHDYAVTIDKEKCIECGLCVENCPMEAIDLDAKPPILGNCIYCTTCEAICPVGAVDIEFERLRSDRTKLIGKNFNMAKIGIAEGEKKLDQSDELGTSLPAEKRLRRLVAAKDVGKNGFINDTPKHPRIVIHEEKYRPINKKT